MAIYRSQIRPSTPGPFITRLPETTRIPDTQTLGEGFVNLGEDIFRAGNIINDTKESRINETNASIINTVRDALEKGKEDWNNPNKRDNFIPAIEDAYSSIVDGDYKEYINSLPRGKQGLLKSKLNLLKQSYTSDAKQRLYTHNVNAEKSSLQHSVDTLISQALANTALNGIGSVDKSLKAQHVIVTSEINSANFISLREKRELENRLNNGFGYAIAMNVAGKEQHAQRIIDIHSGNDKDYKSLFASPDPDASPQERRERKHLFPGAPSPAKIQQIIRTARVTLDRVHDEMVKSYELSQKELKRQNKEIVKIINLSADDPKKFQDELAERRIKYENQVKSLKGVLSRFGEQFLEKNPGLVKEMNQKINQLQYNIEAAEVGSQLVRFLKRNNEPLNAQALSLYLFGRYSGDLATVAGKPSEFMRFPIEGKHAVEDFTGEEYKAAGEVYIYPGEEFTGEGYGTAGDVLKNALKEYADAWRLVDKDEDLDPFVEDLMKIRYINNNGLSAAAERISMQQRIESTIRFQAAKWNKAAQELKQQRKDLDKVERVQSRMEADYEIVSYFIGLLLEAKTTEEFIQRRDQLNKIKEHLKNVSPELKLKGTALNNHYLGLAIGELLNIPAKKSKVESLLNIKNTDDVSLLDQLSEGLSNDPSALIKIPGADPIEMSRIVGEEFIGYETVRWTEAAKGRSAIDLLMSLAQTQGGNVPEKLYKALSDHIQNPVSFDPGNINNTRNYILNALSIRDHISNNGGKSAALDNIQAKFGRMRQEGMGLREQNSFLLEIAEGMNQDLRSVEVTSKPVDALNEDIHSMAKHVVNLLFDSDVVDRGIVSKIIDFFAPEDLMTIDQLNEMRRLDPDNIFFKSMRRGIRNKLEFNKLSDDPDEKERQIQNLSEEVFRGLRDKGLSLSSVGSPTPILTFNNYGKAIAALNSSIPLISAGSRAKYDPKERLNQDEVLNIIAGEDTNNYFKDSAIPFVGSKFGPREGSDWAERIEDGEKTPYQYLVETNKIKFVRTNRNATIDSPLLSGETFGASLITNAAQTPVYEIMINGRNGWESITKNYTFSLMKHTIGGGEELRPSDLDDGKAAWKDIVVKGKYVIDKYFQNLSIERDKINATNENIKATLGDIISSSDKDISDKGKFLKELYDKEGGGYAGVSAVSSAIMKIVGNSAWPFTDKMGLKEDRWRAATVVGMADNNVLDAITLHHFRNIAENKDKKVTKRGADGTDYDIHHTVYTAQVDIGGVPTLIPTVWDGEVLPVKDALERAVKSGTKWPTAKTHEELRKFDKSIHEKYMVNPVTPKEAKEILKRSKRSGEGN